MVLCTADIHSKLAILDESLHVLLLASRAASGPSSVPARDLEVRALCDLPPRPGLASRRGQIRLLHDLANIELQAVELGLRTLQDFPQAPAAFREELAAITQSEGRHLRLCLDGITELGGNWGDWPVHLALWNAASD